MAEDRNHSSDNIEMEVRIPMIYHHRRRRIVRTDHDVQQIRVQPRAHDEARNQDESEESEESKDNKVNEIDGSFSFLDLLI